MSLTREIMLPKWTQYNVVVGFKSNLIKDEALSKMLYAHSTNGPMS